MPAYDEEAVLPVSLQEAVDVLEEIATDREGLRAAGFDDRAIWDVAAVAAFFNMTNRMATAVDMVPNPQYHSADR